MHCLFNLALALLPLAHAIPQYPGAVICDSTAVNDWSYDTTNTEEVTENVGDKGWVNYDGQACTSNKDACTNGETHEVTQEFSISFGVGGAFDVGKAVSNGLEFGVSVAWSTTKAESRSEPCPGSDDEDNPCACGMQYKAFKMQAVGTRSSTNACGNKVHEDFNVTSPILIDSGNKDESSPHVVWRSCRSEESLCKDIEKMPLCYGGL